VRRYNCACSCVRTGPANPENALRYLYVGLTVVLAGLVLLFMLQNLQIVTVSFLATSVTLPVFIVVIVVYLLGMLTGGLLLALLRTSFRGARRID
jgi:putative membrane protein